MEELVKITTAKLARDKGFNIISDNYYTYDTETLMYSIWFTQDRKYHHKEIPAPSQSVLAKWLREEHNLHIWVTSKTLDSGETVFIPHGRTIPNTIKNKLIVDVIEYSTHTTFEDAFEAGLQQALKLIP